MLRKIIEADQLPEYTMTMTKTVEGAPAVLFELRGAAEAAELNARLEAERERHERYEADRRRAGEVDDLMDRPARGTLTITVRSEEHTYELLTLMRISYAVCCLKKKIITTHIQQLTSLT